ncbi:MazG-related protein [Photobacterium rosenbergii]|uniref:MazG-related protein n=1 Tax=Photobacterium rosenbergii TaxID=294936 RepID=A0A2T3NMD7_9GAMM|nr:MazG-related protein [Photobacterium rosenbergii]PSW16661.1 MazG-related protein [Photobacterium rosenbergii]
MSEKVQNALVWVKDIFDSQKVQYQIVGGLAATIHGGSREVADIDLYIRKADANKILPQVKSYISKPLTHYVEGSWDLEYFQLIYKGQKIEIGLSPGTRIRATGKGNWVELKTDFSQSVVGTYQGVEVPTIPVAELISYKRVLGREVDLIDIEELAGRLTSKNT